MIGTSSHQNLLTMTIENVIKNPAAFRIENDNVHLHESASTDDLPHDFPPVSIIQDDQTAYVHFLWRQRGFLTKLISTNCSWECRVYLEKMGAGEVANPAAVNTPFVANDGHFYSTFVAISNLTEGAYKVVATMLLRGPGKSPTPIAAYEEVGILQVYRDA